MTEQAPDLADIYFNLFMYEKKKNIIKYKLIQKQNIKKINEIIEYKVMK